MNSFSKSKDFFLICFPEKKYSEAVDWLEGSLTLATIDWLTFLRPPPLSMDTVAHICIKTDSYFINHQIPLKAALRNLNYLKKLKCWIPFSRRLQEISRDIEGYLSIEFGPTIHYHKKDLFLVSFSELTLTSLFSDDKWLSDKIGCRRVDLTHTGGSHLIWLDLHRLFSAHAAATFPVPSRWCFLSSAVNPFTGRVATKSTGLSKSLPFHLMPHLMPPGEHIEKAKDTQSLKPHKNIACYSSNRRGIYTSAHE